MKFINTLDEYFQCQQQQKSVKHVTRRENNNQTVKQKQKGWKETFINI